MNIKKISIKNFRVFKEKTTFQIRPLTILIGPNNSGKSSLIKFLLLLKEGANRLKFTSGNHNLKDYQSILNWNNKNNQDLEFEVSFHDSMSFKSKYNYDINGYLYKLESSVESNFKFEKENFSSASKTSNLLGDLASNSIIKVKNDFYKSSISFDINDFMSYYPDVLIEELQEDLVIESNLGREMGLNLKDSSKIKAINDNIKSLKEIKDNKLLFSVFDDKMTDITLKYQDELKLIQTAFFNRDFETRNHNSNFFEGMKEVLKGELRSFVSFIKKEFKDTLNINFIVKTNIVWNKYFEQDENNRFLEHRILFSKFDLSKSLFYLSANRGSQKRVLFNQSDNDIDSIIVAFYQSDKIKQEFIQKCFHILGIEGELEIRRYENTISTVKIKHEGNETSLADLGYGYSQVLPIILIVHNILISEESNSVFENKTIILEEPESNLHPNLQSKLAELLVYIQTIYKINFIIESHSEYFIRKLQYLTAKKELKIEDSVIYYFNDDKYVSKAEPKVKEIFINVDGGLTDSFGPGFFDEATKLQFDLIRLQKQQFN